MLKWYKVGIFKRMVERRKAKVKALIAIGIIFCCLVGCSSNAQVTNDKEMAENIQESFAKKV